MVEPVKPKRDYRSPRRIEQAEETRRLILGAAQVLFERQGYAATTMQAVAAAANVAFKTVYLAFQTKSGLLSAIWDVTLRGSERAPAVGDLPWYRDVLEEVDPRLQLRKNARNSRIVKERIGALAGVIRAAAPSDPEIGALWQKIGDSFYENQLKIVASLDAKSALKSELDAKRAADILWTLNHPDLWLLLVVERGWTPDAFEDWFANITCAQLLR